jgi:hypothetical protein
MIVNLANNLLCNNDFNTDTVHPRYAEKIQPPTFHDEAIPIKAAKPTHVLPPAQPYGHCDIYVDDIIGLTIARPGASNRLITAILTAVDVFVGHVSKPNKYHAAHHYTKAKHSSREHHQNGSSYLAGSSTSESSC